MKHFNFKEIKAAGDCVRFATEILGAKVNAGRCVAVWRDGARDSVTIDRERWYDHATSVGGGLLELCAESKFGGRDSSAIQQAQEWLGDWLHLAEVKLAKAPAPTTGTRYDELLADGYKETARYEYRDLAGALAYFVVRLEHPNRPKEFLQGTPDHWGIKDVKPIPYNWAACDASDWIIVVEGEKDAETLRALGNLPATTNSGGAKHWRPEFCEYFAGKKVVILPDNDNVGREHAERVARDFQGFASSIRIVDNYSQLPKGDVTDFITKEGGTWQQLAELIARAPEFSCREISPVAEAKMLNKEPFCNYEWTGREKSPRQINALVAELHKRLLGAPFKVGEQLFDQDRDTGEIIYIYDASDLFSWIARKTGCCCDWARTDGCVSKQEFFSALRAEAKGYSAISFTPDFPVRADVFYSHPPLPEPDPGHRYFRQFVDFFCPVDDINKSLLTAFVMAPIFYSPMNDRPLWIFDSPDGQGSGKSKASEMVAFLYARGMGEGGIIDVNLSEFEKNPQETTKRIISTKGRNSRLLRFDNIIGVLRSPALASLVTAASITGRASYGRDEESRPNNLTYVVTVNGAQVDTDIASRSFYVNMKRPPMTPGWVDSVIAYIAKNRMAIFADVVDIIRRHEPWDIPAATRMPKFEQVILQPACGTPEQYQRVVDSLLAQKEDTNADEELARRLEEEIRVHLFNVSVLSGAEGIKPDVEKVFIHSTVLEEWFRSSGWLGSRYPAEVIRGLAKTGKLKTVAPDVKRYPQKDYAVLKRRSGIMWNPAADKKPRVVGWIPGEKVAHELQTF